MKYFNNSTHIRSERERERKRKSNSSMTPHLSIQSIFARCVHYECAFIYRQPLSQYFQPRIHSKYPIVKLDRRTALEL